MFSYLKFFLEGNFPFQIYNFYVFQIRLREFYGDQ